MSSIQQDRLETHLSNTTTSAIIPVYNRQDTIIQCLESVTSQTHPVDEIIIVDDGSTDESNQIIKSWITAQNKNSTKYKLIKQKNKGKSSALNTGVTAASGDFIAFNDSDDFWLPQKLEKQFELFSRYPDTVLCFSDSRFINDSSLNQSNFQIRGFDELLADTSVIEQPHTMLAANPNGIFMQSILVKRESIKSVFPIADDLRVGQDIDLIFRLSLTGSFCFTHEALVEIDRTPSREIGLTKQYDMKSLFRLETKERIFKAWLDIESPKIIHVRNQIKKHLSVVQRRIALHYKSNGQSGLARSHFRSALKNHRSIINFIYWITNGSVPQKS